MEIIIQQKTAHEHFNGQTLNSLRKIFIFLFQGRTSAWRKSEAVTKQDGGPDAITSLK